jgi:hypothetical protein
MSRRKVSLLLKARTGEESWFKNGFDLKTSNVMLLRRLALIPITVKENNKKNKEEVN